MQWGLTVCALFLFGCPTSPNDFFDSSAPIVEDGVPCDVADILKNHCIACHAEGNDDGRLPLANHTDATADFDGVPAMAAGLSYMLGEKPVMPPSGPLDEAEIAVIERWVADGLPSGGCLP